MKVLMVCLGNICRSPVAEGVLRHKLDVKGVTGVTVDSAGTSGWHSGENPDHRSAKNALSNGVDITRLVSRKFTITDFEEFDRIYVMDASNYRDVMALAVKEEHKQKVEMLLNVVWPGKNVPVPDPYYGGENGFQEVFDLVSQACDIIAEEILETRRS